MLEIIHRYTREDALADGVLIDVSEMAKEAGFKVPVAVTNGVWYGYIKAENIELQDTDGRLWDTLWMLFCSINKTKTPTNIIKYKLYYVMPTKTGLKKELVTLKAIMSPGDEGELVITIMLPNED